eukprot:gene4275-6609_t
MSSEVPVSEGWSEEATVNGFRVLAMVLIFAIKITFGSAPLYFRTNLRFLSVANAFAAGVFLAGGLVHLLPEAVEAFGKLPSQHPHHRHHGHAGEDRHEGHAEHCEGTTIPYVLCAVGFLLTFYLEKVALAAPPSDKHSHEDKDEEQHGDAVTYHGCQHANQGSVIAQFVSGSPNERSVMPVVLTAVLSIHSVISGMALGVQQESSKAMLVFFAIVSHKWVEAFSLGTNIVKATGANVAVLTRLLAAFAVSSPLGILLGWMLEASLTGPTASQATAVLDAAASGTFIYIAVVDTLIEEFSNGIDCN